MTSSTFPTSSQTVRQVTSAELPLSCPTNDVEAWSAHPRVFLPITQDNPEVACPYCSAKFKLIEA
jgi:uncharacterized Zn-finger protein